MQQDWMYEGERVYVPPTAEIPPPYRKSGFRRALVQQALNQALPWEKDDNPIKTVTDLEYGVFATVVPTFGALVIWAKHIEHGVNAELSPFIHAEHSYTRRFTVHLGGTSRRPMVLRAYPGGYRPPLPWQEAASEAVGGLAASLKFWSDHAYVLTSDVVVLGSESGTSPDWFRPA